MPPGFPPGPYVRWDDLSVWSQAQTIAYCQIMDHDENPPVKPTRGKR